MKLFSQTFFKTSTWVCWIGLFLGLGIWQLTRAGGPIWMLWAVQWLPLLLVLPGLKAHNPRAYIGLCFIVLLYFIKAVEGLFHASPLWIDYWMLVTSVILFISAMLAARHIQKHSTERHV